jgi:NitT/TauT family transport system ATP-binding protein
MSLKAVGLGVTYGAGTGRSTVALTDVDLTIEQGEFISFIGPSGCGKSTLLHCLGGLLPPTEGRLTVNGEPVTDPDPRRAAFVFQDYSLLPWKSVLDNAAIGLRFAGRRKAERTAAASALLDLVGLSQFADAYPQELSGGMQQRVAVARALAMEPDVLLMDEPFGALDEQTRRQLGAEMSELLHRNGKTVAMVTHSLDEAIFWADRIIVMSPRPGRIMTELVVDAPRPRELKFIASPEFAAIRAELFELITEVSSDALRPAGAAAMEPLA